MTQILAFLTLLLTVTFVVSPAFTSPFTGFRADQLPVPQIEPPIQPAGYAFAIWGLIYGWLLVSAAFGLWRRRDDAGWSGARAALVVSLAIGTPWLAVANASAVWATILIFAMGIAAVVALARAPLRDRWLLRVPVAIYAGWLTAASFVSLGSTAAGYGLLTDQIGWAWAGIAGALIVAVAVQTRIARTPAYALTVVWALIGIVVANRDANPGIAIFAAVGAAVLIGVAALPYLGRGRDLRRA